ncbi:PAAR domain-containing protein [Pendulispora albinea]|uniref:PAAR domain-containing protein n=1 Tax=Pendulispora albinea TaxID=2741071 RepID=A0ABZ2MA33_9BACT
MNQHGHGRAQPGQGPQGQPPAPILQKESGNVMTNAVADVVNQTVAPFQNLSNPNVSVLDKASGVVGAAFALKQAPADLANNAFARATNGIAKALPSFPAAVVGMPVVGIPHTHSHPPAMPLPLPGIGVITTFCPTVLIGGLPAARSGDYGLGPTCGSVMPILEIFTGSSKVFIGGARAARMSDFTRQCTPAPPAGKAAGAMSKMAKAKALAGKVAPYIPQVMGLAGAGMKAKEAASAADAADAAADGAEAGTEAAVEAAAEAQSAAAEASGAALAAAMMGADIAMGAAAAAMGNLMGKDPGAPPCIGMVMMGVPNVLIGGFPMPSWSDVAKGLKKLIAKLQRGRRGGKARGKRFCFNCM